MYKQLRLFFLIFICSVFATINSTIFLLRGPANSGKSSIGKEIAKDSRWKAIEGDVVYFNEFPKYLAEKFPEHYALIAKAFEEYNIFHAVERREYCFKEKVTEKEKTDAINAAEKIESVLNKNKKIIEQFNNHLLSFILSKIDQAIKQEKDILLDIWSWDVAFTLSEKHPSVPVREIFVHCPVKQSFDFFKNRNKYAEKQNDFREKRFWGQWIASYCAYYEFSGIRKPNHLSLVTKTELEKIFDTMQQEVVQKREGQKKLHFSRQEMDLCDLERYKKECFANQENREEIYLYSKEKYDLVVINNDTPPKLALKIKKYAELFK